MTIERAEGTVTIRVGRVGQWVAGILAALALPLVTTYTIWGASRLHAAQDAGQVRHIVQTESPYVADKGMVATKLATIEQQTRRIEAKVDRLIEGGGA